MSGDLLIGIIVIAFILIVSFRLLMPKPLKTVKDDDVEEEAKFSLGDMSLTATREPLYVSQVKSPAVAKQKTPAAPQIAPLRGATRVKSSATNIDYSIFEAPTYKRLAIQLSF